MRERSVTILWAVCLGLVPLGLFWHVVYFGAINLDDPWYLIFNPQVNQGLSWQAIKSAFGPEQVTYWHPMATLSAMVDFSLLGPYPARHHLSGLFFHAMGVGVFFLALEKMTGKIWPSVIAAFLFAVHPINVEAICWLTQRKTILTGLFGAATLLAYAYYARKPAMGRYLWVFAMFALCVMSKPSATPLPLALLLLDYWPLYRLDLGQDCPNASPFPHATSFQLILEKIPLLCLSLVTIAMTYVTGIPYGGFCLTEGAPLLLRLENALTALVIYLGKVFYSKGPTVFVPFPESVSIWKVAGAFMVLCAVFAWAVRNCRKAPYKIVGLLWFSLFLSPVIGVIQVGVFPAWADRYVYLPYWGLYVGIAWTIYSWVKAAPGLRKWVGALTAAWIVMLGGAAWTQSQAWASDRSLFAQAIRNAPNSLILHNNYAVGLAGDRFYDQAIVHYQKALSLFPGTMAPGFRAHVHYNLGNAYMGKNDPGQAEREYMSAVVLDPAFVQAHNNLGLALRGQGREEAARRCFTKALEINPGFQDARNNLKDMALAGKRMNTPAD